MKRFLVILILSALINFSAIAVHFIDMNYIGLTLMIIEPVIYFLFTYFILWKKKMTDSQTLSTVVAILLGRLVLELPMRIIDSEYAQYLVRSNPYFVETWACVLLIFTAYFFYSKNFLFSILVISILLMIMLSPLRAIPIHCINLSLLVEPLVYFFFTYLVLSKKKLTGNTMHRTTLVILLGSIGLYVIASIQDLLLSRMLIPLCNILLIITAYTYYIYKKKAIPIVIITSTVWLYFVIYKFNCSFLS